MDWSLWPISDVSCYASVPCSEAGGIMFLSCFICLFVHPYVHHETLLILCLDKYLTDFSYALWDTRLTQIMHMGQR